LDLSPSLSSSSITTLDTCSSDSTNSFDPANLDSNFTSPLSSSGLSDSSSSISSAKTEELSTISPSNSSSSSFSQLSLPKEEVNYSSSSPSIKKSGRLSFSGNLSGFSSSRPLLDSKSSSFFFGGTSSSSSNSFYKESSSNSRPLNTLLRSEVKKFKNLGFGFKESLRLDPNDNIDSSDGDKDTAKDSSSSTLTGPSSKSLLVSNTELFPLEEDSAEEESSLIQSKSRAEVTLSDEDHKFISAMPRSASPSLSLPQHRLFYHHSSSPLNSLSEV
jgi:hypothetical protein